MLDRRLIGRHPAILALVESLLLVVAIVAATAIRFRGIDVPMLVEDGVLLRAVVFAAILLVSLYYWDFYDPYLTLSEWDLASRLLGATGSACVVLATVAYVVPEFSIGRGILAIGVGIAVAVLFSLRLGLSAIRRSTGLQERVLILGTGPIARRVAREVLRRPHLGLRVQGFIDDDPALQGVSIVNPKVVGTMADLRALVQREAVGRVVVALSERRGTLPIQSLLALKLTGTRVHDAASFYEAVTGKVPIEDLRPSWFVFSEGFRPSHLTRLAKRGVDALLAAAALLFAWPLLVVVALTIRLDSPGPVLFQQERVGEGERTFTLYKFRSMRVDAEAETGPVWAQANDPRVTRMGRLIRKLRVDELPQLWNVLRGDLSFVGPRPERPHFVEQLKARIPYYSERHSVRPGVTGWAQVRYAYGSSVEDAIEKLQYDLYYIKHMSLSLDLSVLLQTVKVVLLGRGAV